MTQIKMPVKPKLEIYNIDDGRDAQGMHRPMGARLLGSAGADRRAVVALSSTMVALAIIGAAGYHSQSQGAGIIEMAYADAPAISTGTAPPQHSSQEAALFPTRCGRSFGEWNSEVIRSLIAEDPGGVRAISEGAVMRLARRAHSIATGNSRWTSDSGGIAHIEVDTIVGACADPITTAHALRDRGLP